MSYLKSLIKTTGNEFASIVEDGVQAADNCKENKKKFSIAARVSKCT